MAHIHLITGGCRSGKSRYAQQLAESMPGPRLFVATAQAEDAEMTRRIARHRRERRADCWKTIEEPENLTRVLGMALDHPVVLVDCMTLWVSNLMGSTDTETAMVRRSRDLIAAARKRTGQVIFVTNEVGFGIVPDNAMARRFRDLLGRCNQVIASGADEVTLLVCGVPMRWKG